jgi:hypothetical protein
MRNQIQDPAPMTGRYEGDLKYGRRNGDEYNRNDYQANRDENGNSTNLPVFGLPLLSGRDPQVWKNTRKPESKKVVNSSDFQDEFINKFMKTSSSRYGLHHSVSHIKIQSSFLF